MPQLPHPDLHLCTPNPPPTGFSHQGPDLVVSKSGGGWPPWPRHRASRTTSRIRRPALLGSTKCGDVTWPLHRGDLWGGPAGCQLLPMLPGLPAWAGSCLLQPWWTAQGWSSRTGVCFCRGQREARGDLQPGGAAKEATPGHRTALRRTAQPRPLPGTLSFPWAELGQALLPILQCSLMQPGRPLN